MAALLQFEVADHRLSRIMKVIVAGFSKTGTKSMNQALTVLGYKVYDSFENMFYLGEDFAEIHKKGWSNEDFRRMYDDVDAIVDFPANFFWEEIHKAFPDAKIILTVRDNEDEWVKSMAYQYEADDASYIMKFLLHKLLLRRKTSQFWRALFPTAFGIPPPASIFFGKKAANLNQDMMKRMYRAHNAYVKQAAPKDKLLVFNCKEGWRPLCEFLEVPIPDEPFPHKNKKAALSKEMLNHPIVKKSATEAMVSTFVVFTLTAVTGVAVYKYGVTGIFKGLQTRVETLLGKLNFTRR